MKAKILVGMNRPEWDEILKRIERVFESLPGLFMRCYCGENLFVTANERTGVLIFTQIREHWQLGHFDTPVYKEVEISANPSFPVSVISWNDLVIAEKYKPDFVELLRTAEKDNSGFCVPVDDFNCYVEKDHVLYIYRFASTTIRIKINRIGG
jgi:hypothetical protein